jgi:hypothetical protein
MNEQGRDASAVRLFLVLQVFCMFFVAVSCGQQGEQQRKKETEDFQAYVRSHIDSVDNYASNNWDSLQAEFDRKKAEVEKDTAKMTADVRDTYYESLRDWDTFKSEYGIKQDARNKLQQMDNLRKSLTMAGVRTDYTDLPASHIIAAYQYFVDAVRNNKDNFTKDQWTVINVSWKALNGRKRELEKDISAADNAKIVKLQLQYTAIKAMNRPEATNS